VEEDYGVILYPEGKRQGPIFIKKNLDGWQVDMFSTARWVRYDFKNEWYLGGRNHPYAFAFTDQYEGFVQDYDFYDDYGPFSLISENYPYHISQWQHRLAEDPNDFEALISLGEIFFDLGIAKEAVPLLQKAVELNPRDPRAYCYLGLMNRDYFASAQTALEYLQKYVKLFPEDPFGYHYVAVTYWRLAASKGDLSFFEKAAESMKKYTHYSGDLIYGYKMTGYFYYQAKRYPEAKRWFQKILEIDSTHEYVQNMLDKIRNK